MIRLKENVAQFMDEFVQKHDRFERLIGQGRFEEVNPELLQMMERVLPRLCIPIVPTAEQPGNSSGTDDDAGSGAQDSGLLSLFPAA